MSDTILRGTKVTVVNLDILKRSCKKLKLAVDPTNRDEMIVSLAEYFIKLHKASPDDVLACDACGGPSDESFDACPYCGEKGTETEPAKPNGAAVPDAPADVLSKQAKPAKVKPPTVDEKPIKSTDAKAKKLRIVKASEPVVHKAEIVSAAALDDSVAKIRSIHQNLADGHYHLGQALYENWNANLYTLRLGENGKPKYKSWGQWVEAETGIGPRHALDLIAVSQTFTEQDIKDVGVTKLRPMCRIPDEAKRANLLERAKGDLTRNEIEAEVKQLGGKSRPVIGSGDPDAKNKSGEKARAKLAEKVETDKAAAKKRESEGVTAVFQLGRSTLPLFNTKTKSKKPVRAHEVEDMPVAIEDMLNGIKVRYLLVKEPEGLSLVIERVREE
jgi:hypothetical protein